MNWDVALALLLGAIAGFVVGAYIGGRMWILDQRETNPAADDAGDEVPDPPQPEQTSLAEELLPAPPPDADTADTADTGLLVDEDTLVELEQPPRAEVMEAEFGEMGVLRFGPARERTYRPEAYESADGRPWGGLACVHGEELEEGQLFWAIEAYPEGSLSTERYELAVCKHHARDIEIRDVTGRT